MNGNDFRRNIYQVLGMVLIGAVLLGACAKKLGQGAEQRATMVAANTRAAAHEATQVALMQIPAKPPTVEPEFQGDIEPVQRGLPKPLNQVRDVNGDGTINKIDAMDSAAQFDRYFIRLTLTVVPKPSPTPRPPTATVLPTPTKTVTATAAPAATATHTHGGKPNWIEPSALQQKPAGWVMGSKRGELCPAWVHDQYTTTRTLNGAVRIYRTWHAGLDPVEQCYFDHEHGRNPAECNAAKFTEAREVFGSFAFGYVADIDGAGMYESEGGYKIDCANVGEQGQDDANNKTPPSKIDYITMVHMGTHGTLGATVRFHQCAMAVTQGKFRAVVQGFCDTGSSISTCDAKPEGEPFKLFVTVPENCDFYSKNSGSNYEGWQFNRDIYNLKGEMVFRGLISRAVFDPARIVDFRDPTKKIYNEDVYNASTYPQQYSGRARARGCRGDVYGGPFFWFNTVGSSTYYTDAYGNPVPQGMGLKQTVSAVEGVPVAITRDGKDEATFKLFFDECHPLLGLGN